MIDILNLIARIGFVVVPVVVMGLAISVGIGVLFYPLKKCKDSIK